MNHPSWEYFRNNCPTPEETFEKVVAKRLFCAAIGIAPQSLICPDNYAAVESEPIFSNGKWYSYQAKYCYDGKQNVNQFNCIKGVVAKVQTGDYKLDLIYCYSAGKPPQVNKPGSKGKTVDQINIEKELEKKGIGVEWVYAENIIETLRDSENQILKRASKEFFENHLQPATLEPRPTSSAEGLAILKYSERHDEFTGRKSEILELTKFVESDVPFSWWVITGSAYVGKSRLALEFCLELNNSWDWGWLQVSEMESFPFNAWVPDKNKLLVIDYVVGKEKLIGEFFTQLSMCLKAGATESKVRVLLLERESFSWRGNLINTQTVGNWIQETNYQMDLSLTPRHVNDSSDVSINLYSLDFIEKGKAVAKLIDREKKNRWADCSKDDLIALALSTICGGIDLRSLGPIPNSISKLLEKIDYKTNAKMVGVDPTIQFLNPVEPDLFGEYFVLDLLKDLNPLNESVKNLTRAAIKIGGPNKFLGFIYRCGQSFPNHPSLKELIASRHFNPETQIVQLAAFTNIIEREVFPYEEKVRLYKETWANNTSIDRNNLAIESAMFSKILSSKEGGGLKLLPFYISINEPSMADSFSLNTIDNELFSLEYCLGIIEGWRLLSNKHKLILAGPHLVEVFHHLILIKLMVKPDDCDWQEVVNHFNEITEALASQKPSRYFTSVASYQKLAANLIIATGQYSHYRNQENVLEFAEHVKRNTNKLSSISIQSREAFLDSSYLDQIDAGLSILAHQLRNREYHYQTELLKEIESRGVGLDVRNLNKLRSYAAVCVHCAHGFTSAKEFRVFEEKFELFREFTRTCDDLELVKTINMALLQLVRESRSFSFVKNKRDYISLATNNASRFPEEENEVIQHLLGELGTEFDYAIQNNRKDYSLFLTGKLHSAIQSIKDLDYVRNGGLWLGNFVLAGINAYLDDGPDWALALAKKNLDVLFNSQKVAYQSIFGSHNGSPGDVLAKTLNSVHTLGNSSSERFLEVIDIYRPYQEQIRINFDTHLVSVIRSD